MPRAPMAATYVNLETLTDAKREQLQSLLADFDQAWTEGMLADRVKALPQEGPLRLLALVELVKIDLKQQWRRGQRHRLESYLQNYPELGTPANTPADLIHAEYA